MFSIVVKKHAVIPARYVAMRPISRTMFNDVAHQLQRGLPGENQPAMAVAPPCQETQINAKRMSMGRGPIPSATWQTERFYANNIARA